MDGYLAMAEQLHVRSGFVNVDQTPEFNGQIMEVIPTLLHGSLIFSTADRQLFEYPEHLVASDGSHRGRHSEVHECVTAVGTAAEWKLAACAQAAEIAH